MWEETLTWYLELEVKHKRARKPTMVSNIILFTDFLGAGITVALTLTFVVFFFFFLFFFFVCLFGELVLTARMFVCVCCKDKFVEVVLARRIRFVVITVGCLGC